MARSFSQAEAIERLMALSPAIHYIAQAFGDFRALYVSPSVHEQLGYRPEQFTTSPRFWIDNIHPDDLSELHAERDRALAAGHYVMEYRFRRADGEWRWMRDELSVRRGADGRPAEMIGSWLDITERKRSEEQLRRSEARLRNIVENSTDWIWEMGLDGRHSYSNHRLEAILGYSRDEFRDIVLDALVHPADMRTVRRRLPELIARRQGWQRWVVRFRHKDGSYRWLESNAHPMLDAAGRVVGFRGIDRDITERLEAEQRLRSTEREVVTIAEQERRRIGRDLHDGLGQELTAISLGLGTLRRVLAKQDSLHGQAVGRLADSTQKAIAETQRIARLLSPSHLADVGLGPALRAMCAEVSKSSGLVCVARCADELAVDDEIAVQLFRIAQEAVNNAVRHSRCNSIEVRLEPRADRIVLEIADDGRGMPARGAVEGLGLKSMRYRARMIDGELSILPAPNRGTRVVCSCARQA